MKTPRAAALRLCELNAAPAQFGVFELSRPGRSDVAGLHVPAVSIHWSKLNG